MANINLSTSRSSTAGDKLPVLKTGIIIALTLLLAIVVVATFLFIKDGSLTKEIASAQSEYDAKSVGLSMGRNMDVIDLQSRIFALKELVDQRSFAADAMQNIEKNIVSGVVVEDLAIKKDEKTIKLNMMAENNDVVAKQVASFKSFEYFSDVILESTKVDSNSGKVQFAINIAGK